MSYTIKTTIANKSNYGSKRSTSGIKYIVIHYTGNDGDTDESNGKYFQNNIVQASAHYFVDDNSVTQSVPDDYIAYAVGGNYGGGSLYGKATNTNTLSVELCDTVKNGTVYPSAKTIENALAFVKTKMKQYGIPQKNVIRHYDVNGKKCPAYWVDDTKWKSEFWNKLGAGWQKDSTGWWYKYADGTYPKSKWVELDAWYYFDSNGYALCNKWEKINGLWYYFDANCRMVTGWKQINNYWYYLTENGTSTQPKGSMSTGWIKINNKWYYLTKTASTGHPEGSMVIGWYQEGSVWYYLKSDGVMACNETLTINGKKYSFDGNGHMK